MQKLLKSKIIVFIIFTEICLVSSVQALGLGPTHLDVTVERGKEAEIIEKIQLINPEPIPVHITGSVTGPISEFITLEPIEFDLPAGPGLHSENPNPYKNVQAIIKVPRELSEDQYNGEIVFTQQPITGGVLGTAVQLGVRVTLNVEEIPETVYYTYLAGLIALLMIFFIIMVLLFVWKKQGRKRKTKPST